MNIKNLPLTFILCSIPIIIILVVTFIFMRKALLEAKNIGMSKEYLKKVIINSGVVSIIPTLPIIISLAVLMPVLGKYVPWFRLSVIGSSGYEVMAADTALKATGIIEGIGVSKIPDPSFISIIWAMSGGCITSLIITTIILKKYDTSLASAKGKVTFLGAAGSCAMMVVLAVFSVPLVCDIKNTSSITGIIVSMAAGAAFMWLAKRTKKKILNDFAFPFSMLIAMLVVVLINL